MNIINSSPGEQVTFFLELKDGYGVRIDSVTLPVVSRIVLPSLNLAANYPQGMIKISDGLYYYKFTLPIGASAVGSYLAEVEYTNPTNNILNIESYHIIVSAPYGNFTASIGV